MQKKILNSVSRKTNRNFILYFIFRNIKRLNLKFSCKSLYENVFEIKKHSFSSTCNGVKEQRNNFFDSI